MGNSQTKAKNKYNKANYDTLLLSMPKGNKSKLQTIAAEQNISVNKLLNNFIDELLGGNADTRIAETKVENPTSGDETVYITRRKGYAPQPTDALIEIWAEKLEKGYSYAQLEEMQLHTTHKFAARDIGAKVEQLKLMKKMQR